MLGGHVRAVFTLVTFIFIVCVTVTICSFQEIPLWKLELQPPKPPDFLIEESDEQEHSTVHDPLNPDEMSDKLSRATSYGAMVNGELQPPNYVNSL